MTISYLDVQACGERAEELLYSGLFFKVFTEILSQSQAAGPRSVSQKQKGLCW